MDYNIYIHDVTNGNGEGIRSKTKAWDSTKASKTKVWKTEERSQFESEAGEFFDEASIGVLVFTAASKIAKSVVSLGTEFYTSLTGNYEYQHMLNDYNSIMSSLREPVGTLLNYHRNLIAINKENERRDYQRQLLGDTTKGSYTV